MKKGRNGASLEERVGGMFPSCGVFSDLLCPQDGSCTRFHCPFWHTPSGEAVPSTSTAASSSLESSYSVDTPSDSSFFGYTAFVAEKPSSLQMYAPDNPFDTFTGYIASTTAPAVSAATAVKKCPTKAIKELPLPKVPPAKDPTHLMNHYMDELTKINQKIEALQRQQQTNGGMSTSGVTEAALPSPTSSATIPLPPPSTRVTKHTPAYVPTPISQLERLKKEKEKMKKEKHTPPPPPPVVASKKEKRKAAPVTTIIDSLFEEEKSAPSKQRRIAHATAKETTGEEVGEVDDSHSSTTSALARIAMARQAIIPKKNVSANQQLLRRQVQAEKERAENQAKQTKKSSPARPMTEGEKIAMLAKGRTSSSSLGKGETRKSHIEKQKPGPSKAAAAKPKLLDPLDAKIPMTVRLSFLDKFFTHFLKICPREEAVTNAEVEEKALKDKSSSKNGYQVAAVNTLKRLRDAASANNSNATATPLKVSHSAVLVGRHAGDISVGVRRVSRDTERGAGGKGEAGIHSALLKFCLDEKLLQSNGYPRWTDGEKKQVTITQNEMDKQKGRKSFAAVQDLSRTCSRCAKEFTLNNKGEIVRAECIYHFNRLFKRKTRTGWESLYQCCEGDITSAGCAVAPAHVSDTLREEDLFSFIETPPPAGRDDPRSKKVYAMDCEMVYTVWGPALARVSVVDVSDELVLDILVRPPFAVIDANTRFSGLSLEEVNGATGTLEQARLRLIELVNSDSILIGHSLESDLKAMRLVHSRVVDTSVVFPHRAGPPFKRALRNLTSEILMKIIQEDVGGHDSKEDSSACMQLMLHKLKQEGAL